MNNQLKNELNTGLFNVIAEVKINNEDYTHGMPLDYLINRLKKISKYFKRSIPVNTNQLAFGFENLSLNMVQPRNDENLQPFVLVDGLHSGRVDLVLDSTQSDSSKLLEEVNVAKAQLTDVITESSKIAQRISVNPLNVNQLEDALNKTRFPSEVRDMLGNMAGTKVNIIIDEEVLSVGGYSYPTYCADGEVVTFTNCEILKVIPKGQVVFDISRTNGFALTNVTELSVVSVEVSPDTLDFIFLAFASAAKLSLDIEVSFSQHVVKQHIKCWLVQILNQKQASEEILRKWLEISQKLNIVS